MDALVLLYFVACGISRLARYNITAEAMSEETGKVTYFEGTPIPPASFWSFCSWCWGAGGSGDAFPFGTSRSGRPCTRWCSLFVLSGSLMISKTLHIPKP